MSAPLNVAHRGARSLAPENTLAAAQAAIDVGADMWEIDVQLTRDDELIVMHDSDLTRTSDVRERFPERHPWLVSDFTSSEIRSLDCGSWFVDTDPFGQIAAGAVSTEMANRYRGERAPTLEEALQFTRQHDWRINIELKDVGRPCGLEMTQQTIALVADLGVRDRVLLSSFNHEYLRAARSLDADIPTAALTVRPIRNPARHVAKLGAQAYNPLWMSVRGSTIAKLRAAGLDVYVWTVNRERDMRRMVRWGVTGIVTDFPQVLGKLLADQ